MTEQLDVVPQMTFRVVHIRKKYACKGCSDTIRLAKLPKQPIDKAIATPGLLAAVINSKFNHHMPFYRHLMNCYIYQCIIRDTKSNGTV